MTAIFHAFPGCLGRPFCLLLALNTILAGAGDSSHAPDTTVPLVAYSLDQFPDAASAQSSPASSPLTSAFQQPANKKNEPGALLFAREIGSVLATDGVFQIGDIPDLEKTRTQAFVAISKCAGLSRAATPAYSVGGDFEVRRQSLAASMVGLGAPVKVVPPAKLKKTDPQLRNFEGFPEQPGGAGAPLLKGDAAVADGGTTRDARQLSTEQAWCRSPQFEAEVRPFRELLRKTTWRVLNFLSDHLTHSRLLPQLEKGVHLEHAHRYLFTKDRSTLKSTSETTMSGRSGVDVVSGGENIKSGASDTNLSSSAASKNQNYSDTVTVPSAPGSPGLLRSAEKDHSAAPRRGLLAAAAPSDFHVDAGLLLVMTSTLSPEVSAELDVYLDDHATAKPVTLKLDHDKLLIMGGGGFRRFGLETNGLKVRGVPHRVRVSVNADKSSNSAAELSRLWYGLMVLPPLDLPVYYPGRSAAEDPTFEDLLELAQKGELLQFQSLSCGVMADPFAAKGMGQAEVVAAKRKLGPHGTLAELEDCDTLGGSFCWSRCMFYHKTDWEAASKLGKAVKDS